MHYGEIIMNLIDTTEKLAQFCAPQKVLAYHNQEWYIIDKGMPPIDGWSDYNFKQK